MSVELKVQCYAGYKANERPQVFFLGKKRLQVKEIIDQWYGPDHTYFKVMAEDDSTYILRHSEVHDRWELVFFREGKKDIHVFPDIWKDASHC